MADYKEPAWKQATPTITGKFQMSAYEKAQNKAFEKLLKERARFAKKTGSYPSDEELMKSRKKK